MKTLARVAFALSLALVAPAFVGCDASTPEQTGEEQDVTQKSAYTADLEAYNGIYGTKFETLDAAYSVLITAGDKTIPAPTHLFGESVNVIAYSNDDGTKSADGETFARGDQEIAKVFKKGQLGIGLKHHRSEFPTLDLNTADASAMKEHFKLQDTHIEIVVGVERDGEPGAITLNNPQDYEEGAFGDEKYAMIFLRPVFPSYLSAAQIAAYEANVLTMLVGFNAVTNFPGDYNGGDPLGARSVERVREHVKNMVLAITGDAAAIAYFQDPANQVYCAELAHLSFSAGMHVPLNDATMKPLVGATAWSAFKALIKKHNVGESTPFTTMNDNDRVSLIRELQAATSTLKPIASLAPANGDKLAFEPMTMSDIVEQFLRTHMPRELLGEELAPLQGAVLEKMRPGLLEVMKMDQLPKEHPARAAVDGLYDRMVQAVGKPYASYPEFRAAIEPLLAEARQLTGPRGDDGVGLFVPPSLFHVIAQGKHQGGLLGMQYEGHGVHVSAVKKLSGAAPQPTPVEDIPSATSCKDSCGKQAPGGCWCDATCAQHGDCCDDQPSVCQ